MNEEYFIWSIEHGAWWRPNSNGYTEVLSSAGRYSREDAFRISARANWCSLNEVPVPAVFFDYQKTLHNEIRKVPVPNG